MPYEISPHRDAAVTIPQRHYDEIRNTQVDQHPTVFEYPLWESAFAAPGQGYLREQCEIIKTLLGREVKRSNLVTLYGRQDVDAATKFIATMMWGYEAPAGGRRAGYGAHRLCKMFANRIDAIAAIQNVQIGDHPAIKRSYRSLNRLKKCGPNFFTKHFYFLAKSIDPENFRPVIFDDRVATGLIKIQMMNAEPLDFVRVSAARTADSYLAYIDSLYREASVIGCKSDQVEYFLFSL